MSLYADPAARLPDPLEGASFNAVAMGIAAIIFGTLSVICAVTSDGFLEADACTHYMFARFALDEPHYLVNVWGRPLVTGLYALPAWIGGVLGVRFTSLALALICAWTAYRIARLQQFRWPALAFIFTLAQPLVFLHSFSELTELPFAVLIGFAFWAYRLRKFWLMALLIGLAPLGRPEGFGFIALGVVALVLHRKWYWLPLLALPLVAWNHAGWELHGRQVAWWRWLPSQWPYSEESVYASGPLFYFVALLPVIASPLVLPAMLIGIWRCLLPFQLGWKALISSERHRDRCDVLIAALPLMILIGHSALYWLGKMASNGELRYLLVVAPLWGLLSARGWGWAFERLQWRGALRWAGLAAILPVLANQFIYKVLPLHQSEDWRRAAAVAEWYQNDASLRAQYPRLMASHPGIYYALDLSPTDAERSVEWVKQKVQAKPPGTLLIWDPIYGVYNADANRSIQADEIIAAGWREIFPPVEGLRTITEQERAVLNRQMHGATFDLTDYAKQDLAAPAKDTWRVFVSDPRPDSPATTAPITPTTQP